MTTLSWRDLKPHVPLDAGDDLYVERLDSAGAKIARWVLADRSLLLLGGPAGVGKSTELARAAALLQPHRVACIVRLDRFENMRHLTPDRMRLRILQMVGHLAQRVLRLSLSPSLSEALDAVNAELRGEMVTQGHTPSALLNATLAEVARISRQGRVTLLIDGLEKTPEGDTSQQLFEALGLIHDDVELVVVIPWHAAFGPQSETVIRPGEHFFPLRAVEVRREEAEGGRAFLRTLLLRRLGLNEESLQPEAVVGTVGTRPLDDARRTVADRRELVEDAIRWSGGVPRVFLQLMADAGSYAKLRGRVAWPSVEDLNDAIADQVDSFRRILLPGDTEATRAVVGTSGSELTLERKIRLMAHGALLERVRDGRPILDAHPLLQAAIGRGGQDA
jgi:hypothetical protein